MAEFTFDRRRFLQASAALGVAAAAHPRFAEAAGEKVLRIRSYSDLQVLDPAFRLSAPEDDIFSACLPSLIEWKPGDKWEWELAAAESIEQIDDTHIKFTLKPGIMWSNGFGELTAEDVKFSFERVADPKMESPYKDDWAVLDRVEVTDKYSGVIVLKEYFAPLWTTTLPEGTCRIVSRKAVEALPEKKFTTEMPASAGPYFIKEWVVKQKTVLARNPEWKGAAPYYDEIHILPIEDEKVAELGFEAGDLDYTKISLSSLAKYKTKPPAGSKLIEKPSLAYVWLGMNVEHPLFQDIRVRQAVQRAVDVDAILEAAYFGQAERATGIIAPGMPGYRAKNLVSRDVAEAKKLLAEAGMASGFKTKISVLNKTERLSAAQVIQSNLAEIGIEAEIEPLDSGTFWTLGDEKSGDAWKDIQILVQRFSMNPDPSWATVWFTPDQIGVWNWERFNNAEFGELHKQGLVSRDPAERDRIYKRMQDLMEESGAYVFLTHEANAAIGRDTVDPALKPDGNVILPAFRAA